MHGARAQGLNELRPFPGRARMRIISANEPVRGLLSRKGLAMNQFAVKLAPYAYAIMRIVIGLMFAVHGSQKLFGIPPAPPEMPPMNALTATAGSIELVCGLAVGIGLFAGYAAFLASGLMAVAYFMAHFPHKFVSIYQYLPTENHGELAVIYCFVFLYISMRGSGVWSVDDCAGIVPTRAT
jgi:putative oxidoreductase